MHPPYLLRLIVALVPIAVFATSVPAQDLEYVPDPAADQPCKECGVIYEIRPVTTEREVARTMEERAPPAGPFISFPLTRDPQAKPQIGVIGSKEMRKQLQETYYEVVVRFDDDRFTLIEVSDVSGYQVGDRVRVSQNRIEPLDQR